MATVGGPNSPPIYVIEERGLTEAQIHCDIELSRVQLESINSSLQDVGQSQIGSRKRQLRWATQVEAGVFWDFRTEFHTLSGRDRESPSLHFLLVGDKVVRTEPSAYRRSLRTVERVRTFLNALFQEKLEVEFDCSVTWHSSPESWLLPTVLPLDPRFPERCAIQEISGVIGGSTDGAVKFVVDRVATDPMMFHIWLGFKQELSLSPMILAEAAAQGASMLDDINLWEK